MDTEKLSKLGIYYAILPFKRNQDVVKIQEINSSLAISVTDGFHHQDKIPGDKEGRAAADFIADNFPKYFSKLSNIKDYQNRANKAAQITDTELIKLFPEYVSGVGAFIIENKKNNIVIATDSIFVYLFSNGRWYKPKEIMTHYLDSKIYVNDCSRFFGHGNLKKPGQTLYQVKTDVIIIPVSQPIILVTDGTDGLLSVDDLNQINKKNSVNDPEKFFKEIKKLIESRKSNQNDDASILLKI